MKQVTEQTIEYLFLRMSAHYSPFLPRDPELLGFMQSEYFQALRGASEQLVFNNLNEHIKKEKYPPSVSELLAKSVDDNYFIPNAEETRKELMMLELPKQQVDPAYIKQKVEEGLRKIEEAAKNERKRDFNPFI